MPQTIPSYRRVFRVDRRIYKLDPQGRWPIPLPGGLPVRAVVYALATLALVGILATGSPLAVLLVAAPLALAGLSIAGRVGAIAGLGAGLLVGPAVSDLVGGLDWPYRIVILPALVAAVGCQIAPDGRVAHRYALTWLAFRLGHGRGSLGRPLPTPDQQIAYEPELRFAADPTWPVLRRCYIHGPAVARFGAPMRLRRRRRRITARPATPGRRPAPRAELAQSVELEAGERLEVRP